MRRWQGRIFGMAIALSEQGAGPWEEFRFALHRRPIAAAEARGGEFRYYEVWLAAFERVLAAHGLVASGGARGKTTYQFEFGEARRRLLTAPASPLVRPRRAGGVATVR